MKTCIKFAAYMLLQAMAALAVLFIATAYLCAITPK